MKEKCCCFTGTPEKLSISKTELKIKLYNAIQKVIQDGIYCFISGMANGTDIWASEIILQIKSEDARIKLICALPYIKTNGINYILKNADRVVAVSPKYHYGCYHKRNKWMVDNSDILIAVYEGHNGGTKNTIDYAVKTNKKILFVK